MPPAGGALLASANPPSSRVRPILGRGEEARRDPERSEDAERPLPKLLKAALNRLAGVDDRPDGLRNAVGKVITGGRGAGLGFRGGAGGEPKLVGVWRKLLLFLLVPSEEPKGGKKLKLSSHNNSVYRVLLS